MLIFDTNPDATITRRSAPNPQPTPPNSTDQPRPNTLTCLEDRAEFEKLRAAVYQHFAPSDYFEQCLADGLADEMWSQRRLSDIAHQSLSFEIERSYDQVSQAYPNIDPVLRTVLAWKEFDKDSSCRNALAERTRATRTTLGVTRQLNASRRRR